jgi:hypothetical protein
MGIAFTGHLQNTRNTAKCYVASTQDFSWMATGLRMLRTIWDMKTTRLCIINGDRTYDQQLAVIGTTLHYVPLNRWTDELAAQKTTLEVKQLADKFAKTAKKIVEPKPRDIVNAAKAYFVAKKIMADEKYHGISLNCLGLIGSRTIPCPPRMAWSKLNDEGSVGCCGDWKAAISLRLCALLTGRPGFMQDPVPHTVNGTFMGAHCFCPTKLRGFDQPPQPVILRSHTPSSAVFVVEGDGKQLLCTGRLYRESKPVEIRVPVQGVRRLALSVEDGRCSLGLQGVFFAFCSHGDDLAIDRFCTMGVRP